MKKYLPVILVGAGVLAVALGGIFIAKMKNSGTSNVPEETNVPEIPESERPAVLLIPSSDGHWLDFKVQKLKVSGASTMDYELIYSTASGGQQGVPGTLKLDGSDIDRNLLLGSESSGKFRYDVGVETGTMTLRFRDSKGKLIGKLSTQFHLETNITTLTSADGKFSYSLDKVAKGVFFVTMETFVEPSTPNLVIWRDGYGVLSSDAKPHSGK